MSHFYAMLSRMKYINRWGLMRNTQQESICEHSLEVAILAHALAVIHNRRFHFWKNGWLSVLNVYAAEHTLT